MENGVIIVVNCRMIILIKHSVIDQFLDGLLCQIWIDCAGTIADQCRKVMYLSWLGRLNDQCHTRSFLGSYQVLLHCRYRQQRRNRYMVLIHATVGKNDDVDTLTVCTVNLYIQTVNGTFQTGILIINDWNDFYLKALTLHVLDL